jgi:hypothetical protein
MIARDGARKIQEFNSEDTEKSRREHGGLAGDKEK